MVGRQKKNVKRQKNEEEGNNVTVHCHHHGGNLQLEMKDDE